MLPDKITKEAVIEQIKDIFWMYEERVCEKQKKPMTIAKNLVILRNIEIAPSEDVVIDFDKLEPDPRRPQFNYETLMNRLKELSRKKNRKYLVGVNHYE